LKNIAAFAIATTLLLAGGMGHAQDSSTAGGADDDTLELTMTLLPEGATLPDAVSKVISLPEVAADAAGEHEGEGLGKVNEAREARAGGDEGLERAAEPREDGREFGQQMREQAQDDRENNAHGQPPESPDLPDAPDGNPGAPPGPP